MRVLKQSIKYTFNAPNKSKSFWDSLGMSCFTYDPQGNIRGISVGVFASPREPFLGSVGKSRMSVLGPHRSKGADALCAGFPTAPRGAGGNPAETRDWCTCAGQRKASQQEPCADLLGSPPFQGEREGTQRKRETGAQVQVSAGLLCRNPALTCASDNLSFDLLY